MMPRWSVAATIAAWSSAYRSSSKLSDWAMASAARPLRIADADGASAAGAPATGSVGDTTLRLTRGAGLFNSDPRVRDRARGSADDHRVQVELLDLWRHGHQL